MEQVNKTCARLGIKPGERLLAVRISTATLQFFRKGELVKSYVISTSKPGVFADVDVANATKLEAFDKAGKKLGTFVAPVRSDANGHSFVGFKFASAIVARVRITSGTGALGAQALDVSNGGTADLVVMDDFLYTEPVPQQ